MTELNDHLKLLFARAAQLFCRNCGKPVRRDTPDSIYERLKADKEIANSEATISFPVPIPKNFTEAEISELLAKQGYYKIEKRGDSLEVIQDAVRFSEKNRTRIVEAIEAALKVGNGRVTINGRVAINGRRFSSDLHCAECDIDYREPGAKFVLV